MNDWTYNNSKIDGFELSEEGVRDYASTPEAYVKFYFKYSMRVKYLSREVDQAGLERWMRYCSQCDESH